MNKKGAFPDDLIVILAAIFIIAVASGSMYMITNKTRDKFLELTPKLQKNFQENITEVFDAPMRKVVSATNQLKWITTMMIFGYFMGFLITLFLVRSHPAWMFAYIILMGLIIIISVPVSNAYERVSTNPELAPYFSGFYGQNWIMAHLPLWFTVFGFLGMIFLFSNIDWRKL